jgi:putative peptidoglycan lipid II flippase
MVRAFLNAVGTEVRGMHRAAYLLAGAGLLSQLLGLVRDRLFASNFGAGETLDLYYAAFRIPDFLFATLASLLSIYALLPALSRIESTTVISFLSRSLVVFFAVMGVVASMLYILMPALIPLVAPGIADERLVELARILLLQPILLGASNVLAALTQLRHRFFLYSISPLLYNLGIIFGLLFLYPQWGLPGLGAGVVFGAFLHLFIQVPFFVAERAARMPWKEFWRPFGEVLALSVPRTVALAAGQLSLLILIAVASVLSAGSISVFMFAWNLQAVPLTLIGVSYSVAAFPTLAQLSAQGLRDEFLKHIEAALRHILFWTIPATILIIVLRAQLVRTILGSGAFDWNATRLTAAALALFVLALAAQSIVMLIARAYYAAGRTARPLLFALIGVAVTIASSIALISLFHSNVLWRGFLESLLRVGDLPGTTILMLALAYALGAIVQCAVALYGFYRDFAMSYRPLMRLIFQSFCASVLGGAAAYAALAYVGDFIDIDTTAGIVSQGLAGGISGLVVVAATLALLRNQELTEAFQSLRRRMGPTPALEPSDLS